MAGRTLQEIETFMDISFLKYKDYRIIRPGFDFDNMIYSLNQANTIIGFDTETDGTNICSMPWGTPEKNHLVGICLSWKNNQGVYIPVSHTEFSNVDMLPIVMYLFPLLETKSLVTHNGIFDYKVMYDLGCRINIVHDSMLLIFNICSRVAKGSKALKNITRLLYNVTTIEFSDIFPSTKDYGKFAEVDEEVCRCYACADPDYTRAIVLDNLGFLTPQQLRTYMDDCHFIPLVAEAEYYGKPIDIVSMEKDRQTCIDNIKYLQDTIYNYVGWRLTGNITSRYTFKITSSPELVDVMYNKLKYSPVDSKNKGGYKIDKFVLKRLATLTKDEVSEDDFFVKTVIKETKPNNLDPDKPLIDYDKAKRSDCLLASLILAYRKQQKELTTFFNKIYKESDKETGMYYSGISMTNTETSRLVDFMQTLDGGLKYLVRVSDASKKWMFVFDFAQIEYRVMVSLACMYGIIKQLDDPHTDFHVVIAALILGLRPEDISDDVRKKYKAINFAIPYGMAIKGLIDSIYGIGLTPKEYKAAEEDVSQRLAAWCEALPEIIKMLDCYRDIACTPRKYAHKCTSNFENTGYVQSPDGRARVFELGDMSRQLLSKVRRMAGNFPIQCYAAFLFKTAVNSLREKLIEENLMNVLVDNDTSPSGKSFHNKVTFNGFIHDEAIGFADNDVNPAYLMKLILDNCMLQIVGHPTYYCGINIVKNWGEGKEGKYEAPIDFVKSYSGGNKLVQPKTNWPEVIAHDIVHFCNSESVKYVESIAGDMLVNQHILDVGTVLDNWKDYYYKKKIKSYGQNYRIKGDNVKTDTKGKPTDDDILINKLGGLLVAHGYTDLIIKYDIRTDKVIQPIENINPINKDISYTSVVYASMDYSNFDEDDIDDFDIDISDTQDIELLDKLSVQKNMGYMQQIITREFG